MHNRALNFIQRSSDRIHFLQIGTLVALLMCAVMTGVLVGGGGSGRTATIGDLGASPSASAATDAPQALAVPRVIGAAPQSTSSPTRAPSPDGRQVVYVNQSGETPALSISNSDGSSPRTLLNTRADGVQLDWPRADLISMSSQRPDRVGRDLVTIDLSGAMTSIMSNRENLEYTWSSDGSRLLFSYFLADGGVALWMRIMDTGAEIPLGISTSAQKCAWGSGNTMIICGVPTKNALTRDVPADHSATIDDIVQFDLGSGQTTTLYRGSASHLVSVIHPTMSNPGDFVFTNLFDQKLMSLPL